MLSLTCTKSSPWIFKGKIGPLENFVGLFFPLLIKAVLKVLSVTKELLLRGSCCPAFCELV